MTDFLKILLYLSVSGGIMTLLLLGIKRLFGNRLTSRFLYYIWIAVLLRLMLPIGGFLPYNQETVQAKEKAAVSFTQSLPETSAENIDMQHIPDNEYHNEALPAANTDSGTEKTVQQSTADVKPVSVNIWQMLFWLWFAGLVLKLILNFGGYIGFRRKLSRTLKRAGRQDRDMFRSLGGDIRRLRLARSTSVSAPLLLGLARPLLVLPDKDYDEQTLYNVFLHELTHFRRGDLAYKWSAVLVCAVHWFNPLTYFILREINRYSELSCDEKLLRAMNSSEARVYGETLLNIAAASTVPKRSLAMTFATEKRDLKERLSQIINFRKRPGTSAALILALTLLLCGCGLITGPKTEVRAQNAEAAGETVTVSTVDEFLAAIAPDTTIVMKSGVYNLSDAEDYMLSKAEHYTWSDAFGDGFELQINSVDNLCIMAEKDAEVTICTKPRYADVLMFKNCNNLRLQGLVVGHTEEPGICTGGVLNFDGCNDTYVEGCSLYGCGTVGVYASNSLGMRVTDTEIYDCSMSAATLFGCHDVLFDGCEVYDCDNDLIFGFTGSGNCAVINSYIHDNSSRRFVSESQSKNVYLGGLEVKNNSFEYYVFRTESWPITLESCAFENNSFPKWYEDISYIDNKGCIAPDGSALNESTLESMVKAEKVSWQAKPEETTAPAPDAQDDGYIHVSTVDQLLSAIAPNAKIYLESGTYDLSTASNYGNYIGEYYRWQAGLDGPALVLTFVDGLEIKGAGKDEVKILSVPRLENVIYFHYCKSLGLSGFTAGHTEAGVCSGGVLKFEGCEDVNIDSCGLFGCGTKGIYALACRDMAVTNTDIYDCSVNAADIINSENISFNSCSVFDNSQNSIVLEGSNNVSYDGTELLSSSRNIVNADGSLDADNPKDMSHLFNITVAAELDWEQTFMSIPDFGTEFTMHPGDKFLVSAGLANAEKWSAVWSYAKNDALIVTPLMPNELMMSFECIAASEEPIIFDCYCPEADTILSFTVYCVE